MKQDHVFNSISPIIAIKRDLRLASQFSVYMASHLCSVQACFLVELRLKPVPYHFDNPTSTCDHIHLPSDPALTMIHSSLLSFQDERDPIKELNIVQDLQRLFPRRRHLTYLLGHSSPKEKIIPGLSPGVILGPDLNSPSKALKRFVAVRCRIKVVHFSCENIFYCTSSEWPSAIQSPSVAVSCHCHTL